MFSNQKIKGYVVLFLIFCVFSSKGIIIYNEETLVALSFITFVSFCFHYFGDTVKDSLDERGSTIRGELQNFLQIKQESLRELSQEHKRISYLKSALPALGSFTESELSKMSSSGGDVLRNTLTQQLEQKFTHIGSSRSQLQQRLQKLVADNIQALVLTKIEQTSTAGRQDLLDPKLIRKSINLLKEQG